jgi:hypothetical protein
VYSANDADDHVERTAIVGADAALLTSETHRRRRRTSCPGLASPNLKNIVAFLEVRPEAKVRVISMRRQVLWCHAKWIGLHLERALPAFQSLLDDSVDFANALVRQARQEKRSVSALTLLSFASIARGRDEVCSSRQIARSHCLLQWRLCSSCAVALDTLILD